MGEVGSGVARSTSPSAPAMTVPAEGTVGEASSWGRAWLGSEPWRLQLFSDEAFFTAAGVTQRLGVGTLRLLKVRTGLMWSTVSWPGLSEPLTAISNRRARALGSVSLLWWRSGTGLSGWRWHSLTVRVGCTPGGRR